MQQLSYLKKLNESYLLRHSASRREISSTGIGGHYWGLFKTAQISLPKRLEALSLFINKWQLLKARKTLEGSKARSTSSPEKNAVVVADVEALRRAGVTLGDPDGQGRGERTTSSQASHLRKKNTKRCSLAKTASLKLRSLRAKIPFGGGRCSWPKKKTKLS